MKSSFSFYSIINLSKKSFSDQKSDPTFRLRDVGERCPKSFRKNVFIVFGRSIVFLWISVCNVISPVLICDPFFRYLTL